MKAAAILVVIFMGYLHSVNSYANDVVESLLHEYQQQGAKTFDTSEGKKLWYRDNDGRSCSNCHADSPLVSGKHVKTGKVIKPMAVSVNPERFGKRRKIEKWFLRNCKWTLGRECTAQEKVNVLSWLNSQ